MSPGSLVHIGRRFTEDVQVEVYWMGPGGEFE